MIRPTATPSYLPSLIVRLALVVGATFLAGTLVAQVSGDRLTRSSSADRGGGSACGAGGGCPTMLPCGLPLNSFDVRGSAPNCCELEMPSVLHISEK
jgi:hypothetical protein